MLVLCIKQLANVSLTHYRMPLGHDKAKFAHQAAQLVACRSAIPNQPTTHSVQGLKGLLGLRLDCHPGSRRACRCLSNGGCIPCIILVTENKGFYRLWR